MIGKLISDWLKGCIAHRNGRIQTMPNGWIFSDKGCTNANGVFFAARPDATGRMMSLAPQKTTRNCENPAMEGVYPKSHEGLFWVPFRHCRKCSHHRPRSRGKAYPSCAYLVQIRAGSPPPEMEVATAIADSVRQANEITGSR
jgi:hypothetical protein